MVDNEIFTNAKCIHMAFDEAVTTALFIAPMNFLARMVHFIVF